MHHLVLNLPAAWDASLMQKMYADSIEAEQKGCLMDFIELDNLHG